MKGPGAALPHLPALPEVLMRLYVFLAFHAYVLNQTAGGNRKRFLKLHGKAKNKQTNPKVPTSH